MSASDKFDLRIKARIMQVIEGQADAFITHVYNAYQYDDFTIIERKIDDAAAAIERRLAMTADSAAWQGFQLGIADAIDAAGMRYDWLLDPGAEHCADCPTYAAGGPYTLDELPGIPGDAPTECNGGCRCSLVAVK